MRVNSAKMAMLCMSDVQSYQARSHLYTADGDLVQSGESMKVLGFNFSSSPSVHAHIESICRRMRRKYWVLYHLKKAGFTDEELAKAYRICILPVVDYCAPAYHSLLTDLQDQQLERTQAAALRCIYGYDVPYSRMRELAGVTTLRQRRVEAVDKFARKCMSNSRFSKWFPEKESGRRGNRRGGGDLLGGACPDESVERFPHFLHAEENERQGWKSVRSKEQGLSGFRGSRLDKRAVQLGHEPRQGEEKTGRNYITILFLLVRKLLTRELLPISSLICRPKKSQAFVFCSLRSLYSR